MLISAVSSPLNQLRAAFSLMPAVWVSAATTSSSQNAKASRAVAHGSVLTASNAALNASSLPCLSRKRSSAATFMSSP